MPKTLTIKLELLHLAPMDIMNPSKYPGDTGIYLVNDGITHSIVIVTSGVVSPLLLPNKQILDEYAHQARNDAEQCARDVLADLERKFEVFEKVLGESLEGVTTAITGIADTKSGNDIDLAGITKLIAVAQKPALINKEK